MSSHQQLILDLKTSQETITKALNVIYLDLVKFKDNVKSKSSLSYNAVHAICMAIKDKGQFYELYADAIEKVSANILESHWNRFVELVRFILAEFYTKNLFERSHSLAYLVTSDHITTADDVRSHLKLFSRHLYYTHNQLRQDQTKETFTNLSEIIAKSKDIEYDSLIEDFKTNILEFPSMLQTVFVKQLDKNVILFEKFFSVLTSYKIDSSKLNNSFIQLSKYLIHFIYLDITDKNTLHSLNFLRSCKDNPSLKAHKYQSYALNLFYYFIKLLLFPNAIEFNQNFIEIIQKFITFYDRSELAKETWFMDTIVTMARVLDAFKAEKPLIESMSEESHKIVYNLIEKLIKLSHGVSYESGLWACCNSTRKHTIFKLCISQTTMFEIAVQKEFKKPDLGISVGTILKHTIAVAECFNCSTVNYEITLIMNSLIRCAQNVKAKENAEMLAKILLVSTKTKDLLPEFGGKTIIKCLLNVQKITENTSAIAEAYALYIAHLMETNADTDLIRKYIAAFYSVEPCMCVCETLEESIFPLKPTKFNHRLLHSMETGIFHKFGGNNILVITSLLKTASHIMDFILVARQFPQVNVSKKLERKHSELTAKTSSLSPLEHLALGHICKFLAVQQMDNLKNLFNIPKINDDSLTQILDIDKLKQIDIVAEIQILKIGLEAIESFEKFFEFASQRIMPEKDISIDWEPIIDDVAMLARLFHFRGYVDSAYKAWLLLLRITTHVDDVLNRIRALGFLCDECQFIEHYDPEYNLEEEIINMEVAIYECLMNLEFLTPRRQNYILICICNIAWFWATKRQYVESQILLDMVFLKIEELEDRRDKFEMVRATHLAISFRIKWKLQKELPQRIAFQHVEKILDEIRAVVYYTSEDSVNFPILLFAVVNDISEFTTNRLGEPATLPYVQMVLKLALDTGAAFRMVQFLILWVHINLQSENPSKCQDKLDLMDMLYRTPVPENSSLTKVSIPSIKHDLAINPADTQMIYEDQFVRKAVYVNPISPVRIKHKPTSINRDLGTFLMSHRSSCSCEKCSHTFLMWQIFKIGCLNARLLYLGDAYNEAYLFFSKAIKWCSHKTHQAHVKFCFREYEFCMLIQHINLLRKLENFNEAITTSECSIESYNKLKSTLDGVYHINLSLQLESAVVEMKRKNTTPKSPKVRRFLKFSPIESQVQATNKQDVLKASESTKQRRERKNKENIESIIYNDLKPSSTLKEKSTRRRKKPDPVDDICKNIEKVQIADEVAILPKKPPTSRKRNDGKQNLNTAIIIIEDDDDDDDDSPEPTTNNKCVIPKSASRIESTPKRRGRRLKKSPTSVALAKSVDVESGRKPLRRRI